MAEQSDISGIVGSLGIDAVVSNHYAHCAQRYKSSECKAGGRWDKLWAEYTLHTAVLNFVWHRWSFLSVITLWPRSLRAGSRLQLLSLVRFFHLVCWTSVLHFRKGGTGWRCVQVWTITRPIGYSQLCSMWRLLFMKMYDRAKHKTLPRYTQPVPVVNSDLDHDPKPSRDLLVL